MTSPYFITGPAIISFSGGRSSGYMLRQILDAHGGQLPDDVLVAFANTGKERPETLDFVRDCGEHWGVKIHWLEWREPAHRGAPRFEEVGHNSASRNGEPFAALIARKGYLPNPVTRFCTIELKIRVMSDFAKAQGWKHWTNVVGFRGDEMHRVDAAMTRNEAAKERWQTICPMANAGVSKAEVRAFWRAQPFDLRLEEHEGNCDVCFLKSAAKISRIMRDRPDLAQWWIGTESVPRTGKQSGATFRTDRPSYAALLDAVERQDEFNFGIFDDLESCASNGCTD